ncbi:MAG: hypothetical protein KC731_14870 [Myxococcales bacterium]|nr:hypothetical protein [Myxococcales bacterium]
MAEHDEPTAPEGGNEPRDEHLLGDRERPGEAFKKGLGLLWKAARGAAEEIKREVEKGGVSDALQQAGRELEQAATDAAKAVESFIDRSGPPKPDYQDKWPPDQAGEKAKMADEGVPADGGTDPTTGERRDMRIQLDPKDES